ncbi:MAG TPA: hypothetical protein VJO16_11835 [Candidatus Acidoferrum sp.]|nr:hypothetical protein [Candidatus Acidoferrum sp.]
MKTLRIAVFAGVVVCGFAFGRVLIPHPLAPLPEPSPILAGTEAQATALPNEAPEVQEPQDFNARCHAAGVIVCQGFDSPLISIAARWPAPGLYPGADTLIHGAFDRSQKASGEGSLRFEILPHTAANAAGSWRQLFGRNFGEGATFYVQFRERLSPEMLQNDWRDTSWKQVIFHNEAATCADVELTTGQYYHAGFPIMYTDCGSRGIVTNDGTPPYKLQQGEYNCWYGNYNAKDCYHYAANQWITFYYQISIGHWGKPDSSINAWVGASGKPLRQWIKMPNFILKNGHPGHDYDCLTLLTYMTNKNPGQDLPAAYAWYDDLIVSTKPIAPPTPAIQP